MRISRQMLVVAMAAGGVVSQVYAQQMFNVDFTQSATLPAIPGLSSASPYGASAFSINASAHNPGGIGRAWGINGATGQGGWSYTAPAPTNIDLVNKVMFSRVGYVSDWFETGGSGAAGPLTFFCDLLGKNSVGDDVRYYPTLVASRAPEQGRMVANRFTSAGTGANNNRTGLSDHLIIGPTANTAQIKSALDGVFTNTYVWGAGTFGNNGIADGTALTSEMSGAGGTSKSLFDNRTFPPDNRPYFFGPINPEGGGSDFGKNQLMTQFVGLIPTAVLDTAVLNSSNNQIYSNVSGKTDFAPPVNAATMRFGWTKFEVGQTVRTDFNFDYSTNAADHTIWKDNRFSGKQYYDPATQTVADVAQPTTMSKGDANNDGRTDVSDLNLWKTATSTVTVPADIVPAFLYNPTNGKLMINTNGVNIESFSLTGPAMTAVAPTFVENTSSPSGGGTTGTLPMTWTHAYFNGQEQFADLLNNGITGSTISVGTYSTGLTSGDFPNVEYFVSQDGVTKATTVSVFTLVVGDTNMDGKVNSVDFNNFVAGYGLTSGATWAQGDFTGEGKVNTIDFNLLAGNFGYGTPGPTLGSVVPEPTSLSLLGLAAVGLLARRRAI